MIAKTNQSFLSALRVPALSLSFLAGGCALERQSDFQERCHPENPATSTYHVINANEQARSQLNYSIPSLEIMSDKLRKNINPSDLLHADLKPAEDDHLVSDKLRSELLDAFVKCAPQAINELRVNLPNFIHQQEITSKLLLDNQPVDKNVLDLSAKTYRAVCMIEALCNKSQYSSLAIAAAHHPDVRELFAKLAPKAMTAFLTESTGHELQLVPVEDRKITLEKLLKVLPENVREQVGINVSKT